MNMKKTVTSSVPLPRVVHEAFQEYAAARGKKMATILQDWISEAVGIPINKETISEKYDALLEMESIYPLTKGKYPAKTTFYLAYREGRVQYKNDGSVLLYSPHHKTKRYCFVPRRQD